MQQIKKYMNDYSYYMQTISSPDDKPRFGSSYPDDPMFIYFTQLEKINLDIEREQDILNNRGFICSEARSIKKDLKDPNGIFSTRFGQTFGDQTPFIDRWKCQCGETRGAINKNTICKKCGHHVKYVGDDFTYFGWMVLNEHVIIHPIIYKQIEFFFGNGQGASKLENIINYKDIKSVDGHSMGIEDKPKNEPYYGIGMIEFANHFDEIMKYYLKLYPNKKEYYTSIMDDRDKVFTHSIPVYTTHLRPIQINGNRMEYEDTNSIYNMMNNLVAKINANRTSIDKNKTSKSQLLFNLQMKYMKLYAEIVNILDGKKGTLRNLVSGRYNYTGRSVIIQDPSLEIDQVILSYYELVTILEQRIVNILHRSYNISYSDAYDIWYMAQIKEDPRVKEIIQSIIDTSCNGRGIPVLVNRNPTLGYGSILQMFCVGMTSSFVMKLPLRSLAMMNADFDGDALNILHIINDAFFVKAYEIYNPRCAMQISRNDGNFNGQVCIARDTLINLNSFLYLGRNKYSAEQEAALRKNMEKWGWEYK